jgi:hypothetical protein
MLVRKRLQRIADYIKGTNISWPFFLLFVAPILFSVFFILYGFVITIMCILVLFPFPELTSAVSSKLVDIIFWTSLGFSGLTLFEIWRLCNK